MNKIEVSELQGPLKDFFEQLSGKNGRQRFEEFKLWLKKVSRLLSFVRTATIPAQPAVMTSEDYFKEAGVVWMNDNFKAKFFGLKVEAREQTEFAICKLEQDSLDAPILAELGDKAEMPVSQFKQFLSDNRESSEYFILYLRGKDGNLWAVSAYWLTGYDGWRVSSSSVANPHRWLAGRQVVSRN